VLFRSLCWTGVAATNTHDLLPLPYTEEAIAHVVSRISEVQDFLGRQILIENLSSYISYQQSAMPEWEFLNEVANRADCYILMDINNIYVSSRNQGFDSNLYINGIDVDRVRQFHLAGHSDLGDYVIDTHDHPIVDSVWNLYRTALRRFGDMSTMIERDDNIPPLAELLTELDMARAIATSIKAEA
jgi:hypothetical protein